jgi:hypothetical protein
MSATLLTMEELKEMARMADGGGTELVVLPGPRVFWDIGKMSPTPEGVLIDMEKAYGPHPQWLLAACVLGEPSVLVLSVSPRRLSTTGTEPLARWPGDKCSDPPLRVLPGKRHSPEASCPPGH